MAKSDLRLDIGGIRALRNSGPVRGLLTDYAGRVAVDAASHPSLQRHGMQMLTSPARPGRNRATAVVTIAHPGGLGAQAKYGVLTSAVAANGLSARKVRRRG